MLKSSVVIEGGDERRKMQDGRCKSLILTIGLLSALALSVMPLLSKNSFAAAPSAQTLTPSSPNLIRVIAPPRRPFGITPGTTQLPSTLRRGISRYTYTEHRQFAIAADPIVSDDYRIRPDLVGAGGQDFSKSTSYLLSDSLGEAIVGHGASARYNLESGYRQPSTADIITVTCSPTANIGSVNGIGQRTGTGTCTVYTDAYNGYQLRWSVPTGSGGTNTGSLISEYNDTIGQFTPAVANVPDTWSVAASASEWGARLRSASTDTAAEWGTDASSEKWLNVAPAGRVIVSRASPTLPAGSTEIIQFRAEIGSTVLQPSGTYSTTVVLTVVGL